MARQEQDVSRSRSISPDAGIPELREWALFALWRLRGVALGQAPEVAACERAGNDAGGPFACAAREAAGSVNDAIASLAREVAR